MSAILLNPTPEEQAAARALTRNVTDRAVGAIAERLNDQPLAIKQLMARILIEDFAALDIEATRDWLMANADENAAAAHDLAGQLERARAQRLDAFERLAKIEIERAEAQL